MHVHSEISVPHREHVCQPANTAQPLYELAGMADGDDEAANAPLMHHDDEDNVIDYPGIAYSQESESASPSAFIWALTFAAGISGLLFGYEYDCDLNPASSLLIML